MTARPSQRGFTLVEMLVAIAVFATLSVAATALVSSVLTSKEQLDDVTERLRQLETARSLLKTDLIQAVTRPVRDANGAAEPYAFEAGGASSLDPLLRLTRQGWRKRGKSQRRSSQRERKGRSAAAGAVVMG